MYNNQPERYIAAVFNFGERTTAISSSTSAIVKRFLGSYGIASLVSPAQYVLIIPRKGVLRNLFWNAKTSTLNASGNAFTIFVNGVATSLAASWDAALLSGSNTVAAVNVNPGDQVSVELKIAKTTTVKNIALPTVSFELEVEPEPNYINQWNWNDVTGRLTFTGGRVGIGTLTPQTTLDLHGPIRIQDGTEGAGKLLTSDVNGLASWSAPAVPMGIRDGDTFYWRAGAFNLLPPGNEGDCLMMVGGFPRWVKISGTIILSSVQLDFDNTIGRDITFQIRNSGSGNLLISGITISNPCFTIIDPPQIPFEILPQGVIQFSVHCSALDIQNGILRIQNSDTVAPVVNVPLTANILPELEVTPVNLSFDNNSGMQRALLLRNKGLGTLNIISVSANNPAFTIGSIIPTQLAPGVEVELIVNCSVSNSQSGMLTIQSSDPVNPVFSVPMDAVIAPRIGFGPYHFFEVYTEASQIMKVQNSGFGILDIDWITFDNPCFSLVNSPVFPLQIQPHTELLITVHCSATNQQTGWMEIKNSDPINGMFYLKHQTTSPSIAVQPTQIVFNDVTGFTADIVVYNLFDQFNQINPGFVPLYVTELTIDNPTFFFRIAPVLPMKIEPRGFSHLFLECNGSGLQDGTLTIKSTDLDHPITTIPLSAILPVQISMSFGGGGGGGISY